MGTSDKVESMRRSLLQETAHHLQLIGGDAVRKICEQANGSVHAHPITRYANDDWREYMAESWVAFHVEAQALKSYDPVRV